jgi:SAM-dependent methyltransferase
MGLEARSLMAGRHHAAVESAWQARGRGLPAYEIGLFGLPPVAAWQPASLQAALEGIARHRPGQPLRVLDFGCGAGVFLLQLAHAFWRLGHRGDFIGLDRGAVDLGQRELDFLPDNDERLQAVLDRFAPEAVTVAELPFPVPSFRRTDLDGDWDLEHNSADLIVSMTAIPYLADKLAFLERVHGLLKPGGMAVLHFDEMRPPFFQADRLRRVILPEDGPFSSLLATLTAAGHEIAMATGLDRRHVVYLRKTTDIPLECGLTLAHTEPETWENVVADTPWGCRSTYGRPGEVAPETAADRAARVRPGDAAATAALDILRQRMAGKAAPPPGP